MRITVLGSGTSTGVPVIGCNCPVCTSGVAENQRLRCGLHVRNGDIAFLIDCPTDFRQQALRYGVDRVDAVFFTHDHADHINGVDDLRVFNFMQGGPIALYADSTVLDTINRRYAYCFNPRQKGGGVPQLVLHELSAGQAIHIGGVSVTPIAIKHGILDILGFRIGDRFAYLTDCSEVPEASLPLLRGVEVLIVDALRRRPHPTHFSLDEALDFSRRIQARKTWFTHITDDLDHAETNAMLPAEAQLAYDGLVIDLDDGNPW